LFGRLLTVFGNRAATTDWVVVRARTELERALSSERTWMDQLRRLAWAPGWRRLIWIVTGYAVLLLICIPLRNSSFKVWSSFAPENPSQTLQTLWQVQAALVALGFPFLLLLIQLTRDEGVTALRTSEVLARETRVRFAMEYSTAGLVTAGALSAWLASSGSVLLGFVFITVLTAVLLLRSYFNALDLLFDRPRLRRQSGILLREKLRTSMREIWALEMANASLVDDLSDLGLERSLFAPDPSDNRWWSLPAAHSGRIADMNVRELRSILGTLPRVVVASSPNPAPDPTAVAGATATKPAPILLLRGCGDAVSEGDQVIALLRSAFALTANPDVPLASAVKIVPLDD
jgi:hypothetical protein